MQSYINTYSCYKFFSSPDVYLNELATYNMEWNTPVTYLYGFLGLMLGFITMGLLFLACSHDINNSSSSPPPPPTPHLASDHRNEEQSKNINILSAEPNFVVVMAGHETPTCLAKPVPSAGYEV